MSTPTPGSHAGRPLGRSSFADAASSADRPDSGLVARVPTRKVVRSLVRIVVTVSLLTVDFFQLSLDRASVGVVVAVLCTGLAALIGLVALEVRSVMRSDYPGLRAVE